MIKKRNNDTIAVITSLPEKKDMQKGTKNFNAIGWHSYHTLTSLSAYHDILICAEKYGVPKTRKLSKHITINRIWKKGNIISFAYLTWYLILRKDIKTVLVQFEFNILGGILLNIALLLSLIILRATGKKIIFELHQVLFNVKQIKQHINIHHPWIQWIYNLGLHNYYKAVGLIAHGIIVFETELKNRLNHIVNPDKIHTLSLPVKRKKTIDKAKARYLLNLPQKEFVVMAFGFINWYKGIDWGIKAFNKISQNKRKKMRLLVAGGANPYHIEKEYYQTYLNNILKTIKKSQHITYSGFIPEEKVALYFAAADIVILPYRVFMSASGPFSLALSYGKPVLLSQKLSAYSNSSGFMKSLNKANLKITDVFFPLTQKGFEHMLTKALHNEDYLQALTHFSKELSSFRSEKNITQIFSNLLTTQSIKSPSPAFKYAMMNKYASVA